MAAAVVVAEQRLPDIEGRWKTQRQASEREGVSEGGRRTEREKVCEAWRRHKRFNNAVDPERVPFMDSPARAAGRPLVRLQ